MASVGELLSAASRGDAALERLDAECLLSHCLAKPRSWLFSRPDSGVAADAQARFRELVQARREGQPLAYLLGRHEFWSLSVAVNRHTLVPRADTEALVHWALELMLPAAAQVLELGTGCGAIALALARERPLWQVTATDISSEALQVAAANAGALGLNRVRWRRSNWFAQLRPRPWNLILSNPPYIAEHDPHLLGDGVRHEPVAALVSGADGLDSIRQLVREAPHYLSPAGWLLLEHGHSQGRTVRELLRGEGFDGVRTRRDLAGRERVSGGFLP